MGILRLFLALSVIAGHANTTVFGFKGIGAYYAVNFFFMISGFYMAMVLNEKYKDISPVHFYKSRFFRLFPVYYVGLILSLLVSFEVITSFYNQLSIGSKFFFIFQNLFIFGQDLSYSICAKTITNHCAAAASLTINPPAWSLAVELGFYLIAPFILKSEKKTFFYIVVGCIYLLSINSLVLPSLPIGFLRDSILHTFNYTSYASSFIFFGSGALAYHLNKKKTNLHYFAAILIIILLAFTETIMPFWHLLFISLAIPVIFSYTAKNKLDRVVGELSYPAYILHFPILLFFRPIMPALQGKFEFISLGSIVTIVSCILGWFLYQFLEKKVNVYRASQDFFHDTPIDYKNKKIVCKLLLFVYLFTPMSVVAYVWYDQNYGVPHYHANNLTDVNWINGVGRSWAGFFVNNATENIERYHIGNKVRFINGDIREITQIIKSESFINIYLNGIPLDGEKVGYPNDIEVVK